MRREKILYASTPSLMRRRQLVLAVVLSAMASGALPPCHGGEYELEGEIRQTIMQQNGAVLAYSNRFTVDVRACGWFIATTESDGRGGTWHREVGSVDGSEICECNGKQAFISTTSVPVELLDRGVNGHLWLMFASECYWTNLRTNMLTPVFNWHASVGEDPNAKVEAAWELLEGPGSLPREVRYLGQWGETNGLYKAKGETFVGGMSIPSGFTFEERYAMPYGAGMVLRKRVEAEVTSVRDTCSRTSMIPPLAIGTIVVDWRIRQTNSGNSIPSYVASRSGWPGVEEAKGIVRINQSRKSGGQSGTRTPVRAYRTLTAVALVIVFLVGPLSIYLLWNRVAGRPERRACDSASK
jgi:hypothetical protein